MTFIATPDRTIGPGIFAAPGVIGLAVGGVLGLTGYHISMPLVLLLGLKIVATAVMPKLLDRKKGDRPDNQLYSDDGIILMLLSAIAIIFTVGTSFQFLLQSQLEIILALAVAAEVGKIMGGIWAIATVGKS